MPAFLASWIKLRDHLSDDFLGGPRAVKLAWVINLQKGGTLPFVLGLMVAFDNFTAAHRALSDDVGEGTGAGHRRRIGRQNAPQPARKRVGLSNRCGHG